MVTLYILIGPAGCGKSMVASELASELTDVTVLSSDNVREKLYGNAAIQKDNEKIFDTMHSMMVENLKNGTNVIFDATNLIPRYRKIILDMARPYAGSIIGLVYSGDLATCLDRNSRRNRVVPEHVVIRHYTTLKKYSPTLDEGFDILFDMEYYCKHCINVDAQ